MMRDVRGIFFSILFNSLCVIMPIIFIFATILSQSIFKEKYQIVLCLGIIIFLSISSIYLRCANKSQFKATFLIVTFLSLFFLFYVVASKYDFFNFISSPTTIKNFVLSSGSLGVLVFVLIQISQVVCVPIPSVIIILVGTLIYGPILCSIFCSVGIIIGSLISFGIGKLLGKKLISWLIGQNKLEHYLGILKGREQMFLSIAFVFPLFPDDILCLISGISNITFKNFFKITLLTRPIGVIFLCYFGGNLFTHFNKTTLIVLILFFILLIIFVLVIYVFLKKRKSKILNNINVLVKGLSFKK